MNKLAIFFPITFFVIVFGANILNAQPNILFIVSDDLNTRIGPYMEIDKHTPNLDRLAKEGIRFTRTYCQFPLCGPSRASFMSGLYPEINGVTGNSSVLGSFRKVNPRLANHPSMAGFFKENGYYSARVSKIYHMGVPGGIERGEPGGDDPDSWDFSYNIMAPETTSDGILERLSPKNSHYGSNFSRMIISDELQETQADYLTTSQAIAILENRSRPLAPGGTNLQRLKPDAPFFLAVGLVRPHVPLSAPENCFMPYPDEKINLPKIVIGENVPDAALAKQNQKTQGMDEIQQKKAIAAYMASVRFMDQQVGRLLDALDRLQIRDETIVVFISDHGYNLGEHDCWGKPSLWEGCTRVPLIISHPDYITEHGKTCNTLSELIDLYPTLTELCGLNNKQPEILQGVSLAPVVKGEKASIDKNVAFTTVGNRGASIRTDRWRYNRWGENVEPGNEELYDHENDPEEFLNLAASPDFEKVMVELRQTFEEARKNFRN